MKQAFPCEVSPTMLADTKIPAHEQYAGILAVYNILGELHASWKKLLTKAYIEYSTLENEYQVET